MGAPTTRRAGLTGNAHLGGPMDFQNLLEHHQKLLSYLYLSEDRIEYLEKHRVLSK